jgi:succinate dehydrogenase/fumarate reductase flavoprotein subunit
LKKKVNASTSSAANARRASGDVEAKLTIEQQGNILHHALLAGAEDGRFDQSRAAAVVNAMPGLGDTVTGAEWEPLIGQCAAAFPPTAIKGQIALPSDALLAQTGCEELGGFVVNALRASEADFPGRIRAYDAMRRSLDGRVAATVRARGLSQSAAADARNRAMAELIRLGPPTAVLDQCVERFGG